MSKTKEEIEAEAKATADAEAKAKADADVANQNGDNDNKSKNQDDSSSKIDYKAIAEEEKKKRTDLEQLIIKNKIDSKKKKDDSADDDQDDEENKPLTRKDLDSVLQAERQKMTTELYGDRIKEIATEIAESSEEAEAIIEVHKNRSFPAHLSLKDQLEEIQAIINRKRILSQKSELARALKSKETASNDSGSSHQDPQTGTAPKMSASDTSAYKRAGFAYDDKDRVWKKKLPNGNTLIKDPRTKTTYVRPK
jgi:hypothetical protein